MENNVINTDGFAYEPRRGNHDRGSAESKASSSIKKKISYRYVKRTRNPRPEKSDTKNRLVYHVKEMMPKIHKKLSQI